MDYFAWIKTVNFEDSNEVYEQLEWLMQQNLHIHQKLFAIDLLVRKSKGKYIAKLKNTISYLQQNIENMKEKSKVVNEKYNLKIGECEHLKALLRKKNLEKKESAIQSKKKIIFVKKVNNK